MHRYTPRAGCRRSGGDRRQDRTRTRGCRSPRPNVLVTNGGKQARVRGHRHDARPGRRGAAARAVLDHVPRGDRPGRRCAGAGRGRRGERLPGVGRPARGRPDAAHQGAAVLLACPTRPARSTRPSWSRRSARWALENGLWVLTDEIYEHLTYDGATAPSMPVVVPELAEHCVVVNGVAKTYAMTGWRVGWGCRAGRRRSRPRPTCSRTPPRTWPTVSQAAAVAALRGDLSAAAAMRDAFDRAAARSCRCCARSPAWPVPSRAAPSTSTRRSRPCSAGRSPGGRRRTACSWPRSSWRRRRSPSSPARPSGRRATCACPTALGDDDLVEGVSRMQRLLGTAG
jgi:hypothetical protein